MKYQKTIKYLCLLLLFHQHVIGAKTKLKVGDVFEIYDSVLISPEEDQNNFPPGPSNGFKRIEAGSKLEILSLRFPENNPAYSPYYYCKATDSNQNLICSGWLDSGGLIGKKLSLESSPFVIKLSKQVRNSKSAMQLASIDHGSPLPYNHKNVDFFEEILVELDKRFSESKEELGDKIVKVQELISDEGVSVKIAELALALMKISRITSDLLRVSEVLASYASLRIDGWSHERAINGLSDMFRELMD